MSSFWEKLSVRERQLAIATAAVLVVAFAFFSSYRAVIRILDLNNAIDRLESRLLACYERDARTVSVDRAYKDITTQHSSSWTEAEIHNRLRDEIYRLQLEDPEAAPEKTKKLVEIPSLRQGLLKDSGAGYREYQLTIKIPSTDIYSLLIFLSRLQLSQQALRIDGLEIARPPESPLVMANIVVTRTVVDRASEEGAEQAVPEQAPTGQAASSIFSWDGVRVEDWQGDKCSLSLASETGQGGSSLKAEAKEPDASCHMVHELEAGAAYELTLDATATAPALVQVARDADGSAFEGAQDLPGDGKTYLYRIDFTVDGDTGSKVKVRVPVVRIKEQGGVVQVGNVALNRRPE